jgi:hypothetical protein
VGYRSKILARFITADPTVRTYADIGRKAFGSKSTHLVSLVFCLELFTVAVALVTLYADSLGKPHLPHPIPPTTNRLLIETIAPAYPANVYKILGLIVFVWFSISEGAVLTTFHQIFTRCIFTTFVAFHRLDTRNSVFFLAHGRHLD